MMNEQALGQRIAELRRAKGMTQETLAELLAVTGQAVSKWENSASCPDIMLLPDLAKNLGVTVDELLTGHRAPQTYMVEEQKRKPLSELVVRLLTITPEGDVVQTFTPLEKAYREMEQDETAWVIHMDLRDGTQERVFDMRDALRGIDGCMAGKLLQVDTMSGVRLELWVE